MSAGSLSPAEHGLHHNGLPPRHEQLGVPLMVGPTTHTGHLPHPMLQHMVPDLVQQYIETHEVTEGRSRRLLVQEDLTGCAHPPVNRNAGLGLPQLDHAQPVPYPRAERRQHLPDVPSAGWMDEVEAVAALR